MGNRERQCVPADVYAKLNTAEAQIQAGQGRPLSTLLDETRRELEPFSTPNHQD